ncbi:MAG: HAMP domain-containing histidine kinase [Acidobacteria bacterium]|nr:HAMP domain-containing histidine kinase [Acidobacteriota bacterium]
MIARPDILILDHKLPDMTGLDILTRLAEQKSGILTIMISAYASLDIAISATKNGAFDFLAKPFTPNELRYTIQKAAKQIFLQRKALKLAEERRQMRFQFISVLAHELKSPLNAVEGYLNLMEQHVMGDRLADYDDMVGRSLDRLQGMRKMIMDLLDLTRIESGQKNRDIREVDVVAVIRRCRESVLPDAEKRGIHINLEGPEALPLWADAGELEIIGNNFLSNAVKYNRDHGRVTVSLAAEDGVVRLIVADTGIGMSPEEQAKLFGEFVRIKNDKTRNIPGSGLGLSIVRKLVSFYDGRVQVESTPDVGTTFHIELQNRPPDEQE